MKKLLLVLFVFIELSTNAQKLNLDSLFIVWQNELSPDSDRVSAFNQFIWNGYMFSNSDTAFALSDELLKFSENRNYEKGKSTAYNLMGVSYYMKSDFPKAINYYNRSLKIQKQTGNKKGSAITIGNIGLIYSNKGLYSEAINYYQKILEVLESIGDEKSIARTKVNIGLIYAEQNDLDEALKYYSEALTVLEELKENSLIASVQNNIGNVYVKKRNLSKALTNYSTAYRLASEEGNTVLYAKVMNNIGRLYEQKKEYAKAEEYFTNSLNLLLEVGDKKGIASSYNNLGLINFYNKQYNKSIELCLLGFNIANEIESLVEEKNGCQCLYQSYKAKGNKAEALSYLEKTQAFNDSIKSEETTKQLQHITSKLEFEKQLLIQEQQEKEAARIKAQKVERRNTLQYSGIGLGIFALFGLVFLFGRIQLPNWAVELSVFLPFLILFEFLLVITDPYVDAWSGGEPLIKLGLNVLMAALIFPAHSFLERFLKGRLFKKTE